MRHTPEFLDRVASQILYHAGEFSLAESDGLRYTAKDKKPYNPKQEFVKDWNCYISYAVKNMAN